MERNVLYLGYDGDFTTAYIFVKNSLNYTLKVGEFFFR